MKKRTCLISITQTLVAAGASLLIAVGTAEAQKQGGSITVGQELDIPGFDPLKVGVYDTSAQSAAALIYDTLTPSTIRASRNQSLRCRGPIQRISRHGLSSSGRA